MHRAAARRCGIGAGPAGQAEEVLSMAVEEIGRLRTIALVGQGGTGKTQAADAMLFTAGATARLGRPDDGSAAMDFEPEETKHHISISSAFNHLNWKKTDVILADTPGYAAFLLETPRPPR